MKSDYEILDYIYKNASMGYESTFTLLKTLANKENKIKEVVEDILNSYSDFTKQSELLLAKINEDGKKYSKMVTMNADMNIKRKINKDNSDAAVAEMLIKGLTMGVNNQEKLFSSIDKEVDHKIINLMNDFKDFQENSIKKLEKYL